MRFGFTVLRLESKCRLTERQALEIQRPQRSGLGGAGVGAQHFHAQCAGGVVGGRERPRAGDAARDDRHRPRVEHRRKALTKSPPRPRSIASDSQTTSTSRVAARKRADRGQRFGTIHGVGLRLDLLQPHARRTGRGE